jgi:hypothetical protein
MPTYMADPLRRLASIILVAVPIAIVLALFVEACGAIHGKPNCGPLSFLAVPVVVFALVVEGVLFSAPQNDLTVRMLIWASAYAIALVLCLFVLYLAPLVRRR